MTKLSQEERIARVRRIGNGAVIQGFAAASIVAAMSYGAYYVAASRQAERCSLDMAAEAQSLNREFAEMAKPGAPEFKVVPGKGCTLTIVRTEELAP